MTYEERWNMVEKLKEVASRNSTNFPVYEGGHREAIIAIVVDTSMGDDTHEEYIACNIPLSSYCGSYESPLAKLRNYLPVIKRVVNMEQHCRYDGGCYTNDVVASTCEAHVYENDGNFEMEAK
jgi:hypothetical protein